MQIAVFQLKPAVFLYILYFFALYAKFRNGSAVPQFFASPPVAWHCGFFLCIVKKKRAFKHVKRSAFQIRFGIKKAAFPPLGALAVTRNALILLFIYLFYNNIRKSLSFRDSPGLSRFIPAYPVQHPFMTCILPLYNCLVLSIPSAEIDLTAHTLPVQDLENNQLITIDLQTGIAT